jgi:branched-chain amino acid transport system permease protein
LGVRTGPSKLLAFVISASFVGMLGGLWAYSLGSVFPQYAFAPLFDVTVALMAFLGGAGTLAGPILGALIIEPAQQYSISDTTLSQYYLVLLGSVFLVVILLLPEGIIPTVRKRWAQWNVRRNSAQPSPGGTPPEPSRPAVAVRGEGGSR